MLTLKRIRTGTAVADRLIAAGMSRAEADSKGKRFAHAAGELIGRGHASGAAAVAVFVPGRIEVFGKHTDYCGGRSLLCATERGMCFVAVPRDDAIVHFTALDLDQSVDAHLGGDAVAVSGHWSNYPINVVRRVARNFPGARVGVDIAMSSDLPKASGLSSSSAMIVGTFMVLAGVNTLQNHELYRRYLADRESLAGYLGTIENGQSFGPLAGDRGVGTFGGSQDHTAILCCRPGQLSLFSFCPVKRQTDIALPAGVQFVVADSGVIAEKTGAVQEKYNAVSARAHDLLTVWRESGGTGQCVNDIVARGDDALRSLRSEVLRRRPGRGDDLGARLDQFLIESNNLIPKAADAFANGDWSALRWIAEESQARAESALHNQVPQTIALQRAMLRNGAIAASAFGAGFGGSVWGLFTDDGVNTWRESPAAKEFPSFVTRPGCPALNLDDAAE